MVIDARGAYIRVAEPLLDLRDIGASVQGIRGGCDAGGMWTESLHADARFLAIELDQLVDPIGDEGRVEPAAVPIVPNRTE